MVPHNPFSKPVRTPLTKEDLQSLVDQRVAEGWYFEYKGAFPPRSERLAHSVAAFANTDGGWLFVGIEAERRTTTDKRIASVASRVAGFSLVDHGDPVGTLGNVVRDHVSPTPLFFPQVVDVADDEAVLVVYVPGEQEKPFVTRDGVIYRRVNDSSAPVAVNDRATVDRMYESGRDVSRHFERFCADERSFPDYPMQPQHERAWVQLCLSPYPLGLIDRTAMLSKDGVLGLTNLAWRLVNQHPAFSDRRPLERAQITNQSVILWTRHDGEYPTNALTVELSIDGRAKFFLPVTFVESEALLDPNADRVESRHWSHVEQRISVLLEEFPLAEWPGQFPRFFNLAQLWRTVNYALASYHLWIGEEPTLTDLRVGARITGAWRATPVHSSDVWNYHVARFGLPMVRGDEVTVPHGIGRGLVMTFQDGDAVPLWRRLCLLLGQAFGLPEEVSAVLLSTTP